VPSERRLASTASIFVGAAIVQRAAPFLLLLVLAGAVPVETYGQFGVLTSLFTLVVAFAGLGLEAAAFRGSFAHTDPHAETDYFSALAKIALGGPLLLVIPTVVVVCLVGGHLFGIGAATFASVIAGSALYAAATTVPLARLRAQGRVRAYVICAVAPTLLQCLTKFVCCVVLDLGPAGWAVGDLVAGVFALCLTLPVQYRDLVRWPVSGADTVATLRLSLPLLPHVMSSWVLNLSDRILVAGIAGVTAAGQYALVAQLASVGMIVTTELNRALAPAYGQAIAATESATRRLARLVDAQRMASVGIYVLTALGSWAFIQLVAPPAYRAGGGWALVLCSGLLIYSFYYPPMNVLSIIEGRTSLVPLITGSAAAANVLLNLALLGRYGAAAAAYSTVAGYTLLFALSSAYAGRNVLLSWRLPVVALCSSAAITLLGIGTWLTASA
jgi:O-antigen/teichoic acid export membrane protein